VAWKRWLAFSCVHRPVHDEAACDWLVEQIREYQPEYLICLGDMFDAEVLSKFEKATRGLRLKEEYESAAEMLQRLKDAGGRKVKKKIWLRGNHEDRMFRPEWSDVSELLDYRIHIKEAKDWEHYDYEFDPRKVFRLGQVTFYHGFVCGRSTAKSESVKLGVPYGLTVSGHTHRPFPLHRISMVTPLPYWQINPGTLIAKPDYMKTKDTSLWGQGVIVGQCDPDVLIDTRQHWEAELILRQMYWDVGGFAA
jgi:predicted phosphodiesterase